MQAIVTTFFEATTKRAARIKAAYSATNMIVPWNYELEEERNHRAAAEALRAQIALPWALATGQLAPNAYVHVMIGEAHA